MTIAPAFHALRSESITAVDLACVQDYNQRASSKFRLRTELGPLAYEGDLENARVALLLSNPGFGEESTLESLNFTRDGWPLSGIHPDAPLGTLKWQRRLLKHLISLVCSQLVSQRVAKLELTPWASVAFDRKLRLPSRRLVLDAAAELARRGIPLVVLRSEELWLEEPSVAGSPHRYRVNNWRSASVSPGNLTQEGWMAVSRAIQA
jgi:hypothetical protein